MKDSARYAKIVEWSEEDQCYVGSAARSDLWWLPWRRREGRVRGALLDRRGGHRAVPSGRQTPAPADLGEGLRQQDAAGGVGFAGSRAGSQSTRNRLSRPALFARRVSKVANAAASPGPSRGRRPSLGSREISYSAYCIGWRGSLPASARTRSMLGRPSPTVRSGRCLCWGNSGRSGKWGALS